MKEFPFRTAEEMEHIFRKMGAAALAVRSSLDAVGASAKRLRLALLLIAMHNGLTKNQ